MISRLKTRAWIPIVSAVTAWTALAVSATPAVPAPSTPETDTSGPDQSARDTSDGTFESCSAYFGFGKGVGVLDVVDFDVTDAEGTDSADHSVESDTPVVLVLENETGDELECSPFEVSESQWTTAMNDTYVGAHGMPAWPGPGHYAYPSIAFDPLIDGFGMVTAVGFRVVGTPADHTLVSPTGVAPLVQHHIDVWDPATDLDATRLAAFLTATVSDTARDSFLASFERCAADEWPFEFDSDGLEALNAINEELGEPLIDPGNVDEVGCFEVMTATEVMELVLGVEATIGYREPIVLAAAGAPTTTTTLAPTETTVAPGGGDPTPAQPIVADPAYTG